MTAYLIPAAGGLFGPSLGLAMQTGAPITQSVGAAANSYMSNPATVILPIAAGILATWLFPMESTWAKLGVAAVGSMVAHGVMTSYSKT